MRDALPSNDPVERLRRRAAAMSDTGAALKKLADATEPLYKSLDENQKHRFALLYHPAHSGLGGFHRREARLEQFGDRRL
jgi:hypothetical protein